jgi:hypothetical protein
LDPAWNLGGYTVAQFREFWIALQTLCWIHHWLWFSYGVDELALNSAVVIRQRKR